MGTANQGLRGLIMDKREILNCLSEFPYDRNEYWVITGGAMVLYDIRAQTADIDLGCSERLADRLEADGCLFRRTEHGKRWFKYGKNIEIFEEWLMDGTESVHGFKIISIKGLIEMKQELGREKDKKDIETIQNVDINISQKSTENDMQEKLSEKDKRKLKDYLSGVYEIDEKNININ